MTENLTENQVNIQRRLSNPDLLTPQKNWWKIGVLVTLALFLATVGVLGFYVLRMRKGEELPQPTPVSTPAPTLTPIPTPVVFPTPMVSTPDPTADWEVYTNTENEYSIKYPPNWFYEDFGQLDPKTLDHVGFHPRPPANEFTAIAVDVSSRSYEEQLQLGVQQSEPVSVGEVWGVRKIEKSPSGEVVIQIILPRPNYTLILISRRGYEDVFNSMLSTFQFLE